jgi:hypothetical protein
MHDFSGIYRKSGRTRTGAQLSALGFCPGPWEKPVMMYFFFCTARM